MLDLLWVGAVVQLRSAIVDTEGFYGSFPLTENLVFFNTGLFARCTSFNDFHGLDRKMASSG